LWAFYDHELELVEEASVFNTKAVEKQRYYDNGNSWFYTSGTGITTRITKDGVAYYYEGTIEDAVEMAKSHGEFYEVTQESVPIEVYEQDEPQLGDKFDSEKPMLSILTRGCPRALMAVGQALTYGAEKYGESPDKLNFLEVPNGFNRYSDAMIRHHLQESLEDLDESGLEHITLTAVNALFRLELYLRAKENDNGN